jgi:hypothetical protein
VIRVARSSTPKNPRSTAGADPWRRVPRLLAVTAGAFALLVTIVPPQAGAIGSGLVGHGAAGGRTLLRASAYGTQARVGQVIVSSKTARAALPGCGTFNPPAHAENTIAMVDSPLLIHTGVINTTADGTVDLDGTQRAVGTSEVNDISLLSGLITADTLRLVSTTTHDLAGFHTSTDGTRWVNLKVAGTSVGTPGVNQRIDLPGLGYVVLNEQTLSSAAQGTTFTVTLLHVVITAAIRGVEAGTEITVAGATSGIVLGLQGALSGFAFGTFVMVPGRPAVIISGKTAQVALPCIGTKGTTTTSTISTVSVDNILTGGVVTDTAFGQIEPSEVTGETTSTIAGLNLLNGTVTADAIVSDAHARTTDGGLTIQLSDAGTGFVNLQVAGFPAIGDDVAVNTHVDIAGLGRLWFRHTRVTKNAITIVAVELVVNRENTLGLAIGTDIQIGVADAAAY